MDNGFLQYGFGSGEFPTNEKLNNVLSMSERHRLQKGLFSVSSAGGHTTTIYYLKLDDSLPLDGSYDTRWTFDIVYDDGVNWCQWNNEQGLGTALDNVKFTLTSGNVDLGTPPSDFTLLNPQYFFVVRRDG